MENYSEKLVHKPGTAVKLKNVSCHWHGRHESKKKSLPEFEKYLKKMDELQYLMYAENKHSLLIVLQGLDGAGKDGSIRHVMSRMNPQGCVVTSFKTPTLAESSHDFLWRIHSGAPRKGMVSIFNRSHYEDVLITRVHKLVSKKECFKRYGLINEFERLLTDENNTTILKFFLNISKEEQLRRFGQRLNDPARHWKISEGDYKEREYWNDYMHAYEDLLQTTSTERAPWYIIPADHKWFRNLAIAQIITKTLEGFKMKRPGTAVDLTEMRVKYHAAMEEGNHP